VRCIIGSFMAAVASAIFAHIGFMILKINICRVTSIDFTQSNVP
jgi:hypothetical protein